MTVPHERTAEKLFLAVEFNQIRKYISNLRFEFNLFYGSISPTRSDPISTWAVLSKASAGGVVCELVRCRSVAASDLHFGPIHSMTTTTTTTRDNVFKLNRHSY